MKLNWLRSSYGQTNAPIIYYVNLVVTTTSIALTILAHVSLFCITMVELNLIITLGHTNGHILGHLVYHWVTSRADNDEMAIILRTVSVDNDP